MSGEGKGPTHFMGMFLSFFFFYMANSYFAKSCHTLVVNGTINEGEKKGK